MPRVQDTIHVYNTITFETLHVLKGHQGQVTCVSWSLDDLKLASCADNGSLYEWNVATGENMINTRSVQTMETRNYRKLQKWWPAVHFWGCRFLVKPYLHTRHVFYLL